MTDITYDIFCDFAVLQNAHERARLSKRNKDCVVRFEIDTLGQLARLQEELAEKTYTLKNYYSFMVHDPKPRKIEAISYRDRIVQHVLCDNVLEPYFRKRIIYDNCACVKGRGQFFAISRMREFLKQHYHKHGADGYVLKCDIKKFFPSLSHEVIKKQISSQIGDKDVRALFDMIIDSYQSDQKFLTDNKIPTHEKKFIKGVGWREVLIKRGVPIGNQTSQIIGTYYLDPIDRFCKEKLRIKHYIRYMDDFVMIHPDKEFLQKTLVQINEMLWRELKVLTNAKTQIHPLKNGVKFLGHRLYIKENGKIINRIVPRTIKRFKKAVRKINAHHEFMESENMQSTVASYMGYFKYSNSRGKSKRIKQKLNVKINRKKTLQEIYDEINGEM